MSIEKESFARFSAQLWKMVRLPLMRVGDELDLYALADHGPCCFEFADAVKLISVTGAMAYTCSWLLFT